ncbi:MAG: Hsp70 family protein [Chloroflexi bacterium]|nr:Hsp70 family protein [Chloroflexota bacterium]
MRLGIDFGTTNSSVARYDGARLDRIQLDPANDNIHVLPSLLYIDRAQRARVGTAAAADYLARETGRPVKWEKRIVGEIDYDGADMSYVQAVHVMVDAAAQGRLLQYVKTGLRDPSYEGTQVFDRFYTVDELIALILRQMKNTAEDQLGEASDAVVLGRPVQFSDDDAITARAEEILFKGARLAGFRDIRFELEPIGATFYYHAATQKRATALIFDFGGGTLDLTIARVGGADAPEILATHGVLVGGDDLDRRVMQSLRKYFGGGASALGKRPLPDYILELLDNWQTMPILSRPAYQQTLEELRPECVNPRGIDALKTLVTHNLGFELFRAIEKTKKQLSDQHLAELNFEREGIAIREWLTRRDFETLIRGEVELARAGVLETLRRAVMKPQDVDVVLRTGGTSAVPLFATMLAKIFGAEKIQELDLLTSVVGGLAIVAHQEGGAIPACRARYATPDAPILANIRAQSERAYEAYDFRIGERCYTDQRYTLTRLPVELSGLPAIRAAQADKHNPRADFLQFDLTRPARVFVAYDARIKPLPAWLAQFTPHPKQIQIDQWGAARYFQLLSRDFDAGRVQLGGNGESNKAGSEWMNYFVIAQAVGA